MSRDTFDPESIRQLAAILVETGLTEIEIADKDSRIRVARTPASVVASFGGPGQAVAGAAPPPALAPETPSTTAVDADDAKHPGAVLSPMVGVVYLAAEPGSAPFVTAGQSVTTGQTLLLVEAMKTFNQIKAPRAGTVARILVSTGTPVEYGEVLMVLE